MTGEETVRVAPAPPALALTRAAQELELRRDEFQLAVQLGLVRTVPGTAPGTPRPPGAASGVPPGPASGVSPGAASEVASAAAPGGVGVRGGRRRVERSEIDRLRSAPDFPAGLRDRVRAVGTGEAAALLAVPPDRFTRLARTGHFSPVRFCLNRYRAVVWLYLAGELGEFALTHPGLLTGRLPRQIRERVDGGEDRRPRNWRARRLGLLLRSTEDPWARAAAIASLLDPGQLSEVVDDPHERTHLQRLRPEPPSGRTESAAARDIADRLTVADDPDEILWHRMSLALALDEARADRPAPRPDTAPAPAPAPDAPTPRPPRAPVLIRPPALRTRSSLLDRLRRRRATADAATEEL
ncbi:DUF6397 family protein [Streptomyces sp. NPDC057426]|uniref:DUF6397 family protein n=1 Tax=Streptomyces sp. NPDC057426 TaxID=3346128 RepID=UPI0036AD07F8